jgi:hypothetical protein
MLHTRSDDDTGLEKPNDLASTLSPHKFACRKCLHDAFFDDLPSRSMRCILIPYPKESF